MHSLALRQYCCRRQLHHCKTSTGPALDALGLAETQYSPTSFRYDLSKLRAKGLVGKVPHFRRYRLVGKGYSICLVSRALSARPRDLGI
jgi:hypothetical protein